MMLISQTPLEPFTGRCAIERNNIGGVIETRGRYNVVSRAMTGSILVTSRGRKFARILSRHDTVDAALAWCDQMAVAEQMRTLCPECGSGNIERTQDQMNACCSCGNTYDDVGNPAEIQ